MWVLGSIASLPQGGEDFLQFLFQPDVRQAELADLPDRIRVRWYREPAELNPGERWQLKLRLQPPRGTVNFQGRDGERSLFTAGIGALGTVLEAEKIPGQEPFFGSQTLRSLVRDRIGEVLPGDSSRALVLSLAIADRGALRPADWKVLRTTGTGHLLAISGLHIGLAAVIGFWLFRCVLFIVPAVLFRGMKGFTFACIGAVICACAYGMLAGFPVSTVRALTMLAVAVLAVRIKAVPGVVRAWLLALLAVLVLNPFAFLTAGFWLSFAAVLGLILFFAPRCGREKWWLSLPRAQLAVMALTLPLGAYWFQSCGSMALPSNLLAIPLVSFVVVPLILAAILLMPVSWLSAWILELAAWSCDLLLTFLRFMASWSGGDVFLTPRVGVAETLVGVSGGLLLLLPRGLASRWLGLCILATLFLPRAPELDSGEYSIETLDVGQGLAVVVRTRNHSLLYDTGPGNGDDWSLVDSVIAPALAADGRGGPDAIVVSHADLDHAGGLVDVALRFENAELLFNGQDEDGTIDGCHAGRSWNWEGVEFEVLHPSPWLPYLGNDSSCVISIDNGYHRALLTGDISSSAEMRLVPTLGVYDFLTVPHHGSSSSSSEEFLAKTKPSLAVVSAAYGNRFGFPRAAVVQGYERIGTELLSTIDCGAIRIAFPAGGLPMIEAARMDGVKPWRWRPNPSDCMVTPGRAMYHLDRPNNKE